MSYAEVQLLTRTPGVPQLIISTDAGER